MGKDTFWICIATAALALGAPLNVVRGQEADAGAEEAAEAPAVTDARGQAIPLYNQGVDALGTKDLSTALELFLQASQIDPDFIEAHVATAAVAMELKDFWKAADAAEEILRLQPDNVDAVGTAYFAELMIGDLERLIPSARRLVEVNPDVASAEMLQHAQVLFDDNELAGSRLLLGVILDSEPGLAAAYLQLGLTCNMEGDTECAKQAFRKFLELAPEDPDAETARSLLAYLE